MTIRPELLDELLKDFSKPEDLTGEGGILQQSDTPSKAGGLMSVTTPRVGELY